MISALNASAGALQTLSSQMQSVASRVARPITPDAPAFPEDPADALVEGKVLSLAYQANARVITSADRMVGTLLDLFA